MTQLVSTCHARTAKQHYRRRSTCGDVISSPVSRWMFSMPILKARRTMGASGRSVVTCVISARFFTRPHDCTKKTQTALEITLCQCCTD